MLGCWLNLELVGATSNNEKQKKVGCLARIVLEFIAEDCGGNRIEIKGVQWKQYSELKQFNPKFNFRFDKDRWMMWGS